MQSHRPKGAVQCRAEAGAGRARAARQPRVARVGISGFMSDNSTTSVDRAVIADTIATRSASDMLVTWSQPRHTTAGHTRKHRDTTVHKKCESTDFQAKRNRGKLCSKTVQQSTMGPRKCAELKDFWAVPTSVRVHILPHAVGLDEQWVLKFCWCAVASKIVCQGRWDSGRAQCVSSPWAGSCTIGYEHRGNFAAEPDLSIGKLAPFGGGCRRINQSPRLD